MGAKGGFPILGGSVLMWACAATSALGGTAPIKAPLEQQCSRHKLQACDELVAGLILYVDGDEPAARQRLKRAAAKNFPEDLQRFSGAIAAVLPGDSGSAITAILTGEPERGRVTANASNDAVAAEEVEAESAPSPAAQPEPQALARLERVHLSMAAPTDPIRMTTVSVSPLGHIDRFACEVWDSNAVCVTFVSGPFVITDAITPPGCTKEFIIGAADANGQLAWIAPTAAPGFHGARFFVRRSQSVVVAARGMTMEDPGDHRCYVTWAGFRPRVWLPDM